MTCINFQAHTTVGLVFYMYFLSNILTCKYICLTKIFSQTTSQQEEVSHMFRMQYVW